MKENSRFTPAPTKQVRLVDENGKVVRIVPMNRKQRRRLGVKPAK